MIISKLKEIISEDIYIVDLAGLYIAYKETNDGLMNILVEAEDINTFYEMLYSKGLLAEEEYK